MYEQIATNSRAAGWLQRIRSIKSSLSLGPDTASCGTTSSRADELAGTWTTTLRTGDWKDAGFDGLDGTFTLTFAHGYVTVTDPDGSIGYGAAYDAFRGVVVTSGREDRLRASYRVNGSQLMINDLSMNGVHEPSPYTVVRTTHAFTRQR